MINFTKMDGKSAQLELIIPNWIGSYANFSVCKYSTDDYKISIYRYNPTYNLGQKEPELGNLLEDTLGEHYFHVYSKDRSEYRTLAVRLPRENGNAHLRVVDDPCKNYVDRYMNEYHKWIEAIVSGMTKMLED